MSIPVKIPSLPFSMNQARIGHWYKNLDEVVARHEILLELEVHGEVIPIVAPQAGILEKKFFNSGDFAEVGAVVALLKSGLPNLVWDEERKTLILDSYKAADVDPSMEYALRQMIRLGEGKIGKGFGSGMALPQTPPSTEPGLGMGKVEQTKYFKSQPKLAESSQFAGDYKDPNVTRVPENEGAQLNPQNAPTLGASPKMGPGAPTPKPMGG